MISCKIREADCAFVKTRVVLSGYIYQFSSSLSLLASWQARGWTLNCRKTAESRKNVFQLTKRNVGTGVSVVCWNEVKELEELWLSCGNEIRQCPVFIKQGSSSLPPPLTLSSSTTSHSMDNIIPYFHFIFVEYMHVYQSGSQNSKDLILSIHCHHSSPPVTSCSLQICTCYLSPLGLYQDSCVN